MKTLCIALHDVAPQTWPACARVLAMLERLGMPPVTLLVVPDFHGHGAVDRHWWFVEAIHRRAAHGAEIALHGFTHRDDAPPSRTVGERAKRSLLTCGEGEFSALGRDEAGARIERGVSMLERCGWRTHGFVPPAWLLSDGAKAALRQCALRYYTDHAGFVVLPGGRRIAAPVVTISPRSRVRRVASRAWLRLSPALFHTASVLRIGLHPADAMHPELMRAWERLLSRLLRERRAVTKLQAIGGGT